MLSVRAARLTDLEGRGYKWGIKKKKNDIQERDFFLVRTTAHLLVFYFLSLGAGCGCVGGLVCVNRYLLTTGQFQFSLKLLNIQFCWHLRKAVIVLFPWHIYPMRQVATCAVWPSLRGVSRERAIGECHFESISASDTKRPMRWQLVSSFPSPQSGGLGKLLHGHLWILWTGQPSWGALTSCDGVPFLCEEAGV